MVEGDRSATTCEALRSLNFRGSMSQDVTGAQSAYRLLDVLEELTFRPGGSNLTAIAAESGLSISTTRRLLSVLVSRGYAEKEPHLGTYSAGPAVKMFGALRPSLASLQVLAHPVLARLGETIDETVFLSVRDGLHLTYVDVIQSMRPVSMRGRPGIRIPLHATSQGKVTLAHLPEVAYQRIIERSTLTRFTRNTVTQPGALREMVDEVRVVGFAVNLEESEKGIHSIAMAVVDPLGNLIATVCVGGPADRMPRAAMERDILPSLEDACLTITGFLRPRVATHVHRSPNKGEK